MLFVVGCLLRVDRRCLPVMLGLLFVVRAVVCLLFVVCVLLFVFCCVLFVVCCLLYVVRSVSLFCCQLVCVMSSVV